MQRVQDVANIYGGIAGAMPGSPTQPFQPMPLATGIGGGLSAAYMMGMGRDNTATAAATQPQPLASAGNPFAFNLYGQQRDPTGGSPF